MVAPWPRPVRAYNWERRPSRGPNTTRIGAKTVRHDFMMIDRHGAKPLVATGTI
jgi:hypothetical protein